LLLLLLLQPVKLRHHNAIIISSCIMITAIS
jgi:hypothetical protein